MIARNLVLVAITAGVLAIAFVMLRPDGSVPHDTRGAAAVTDERAAPPAGTVDGASDQAAPASQSGHAAPATDTPAQPPPEPALTARVRLQDGQRVDGPAAIRVSQGETVRVAFSSNAPAELHLHGYDLTVNLAAGETRVLRFVAEHSGRFAYELHGHHHGGHASLGVIEVLPR